MGKKDTFKVGDFVFAKVKGYRPWPAKIVAVVSKKYSVYFYGTQEVGNNIKVISGKWQFYFSTNRSFLNSSQRTFGILKGTRKSIRKMERSSSNLKMQ
jgi:hypothetical protein